MRERKKSNIECLQNDKKGSKEREKNKKQMDRRKTNNY